jgi:hypothetical protein
MHMVVSSKMNLPSMTGKIELATASGPAGAPALKNPINSHSIDLRLYIKQQWTW